MVILCLAACDDKPVSPAVAPAPQASPTPGHPSEEPASWTADDRTSDLSKRCIQAAIAQARIDTKVSPPVTRVLRPAAAYEAQPYRFIEMGRVARRPAVNYACSAAGDVPTAVQVPTGEALKSPKRDAWLAHKERTVACVKAGLHGPAVTACAGPPPT
jgi:hypothetical protein